MTEVATALADLTGRLAEIEWVASLFPVRPARGKQVTVMFTDIAGFTAYAAARGDRAAMRLVTRHDRAVLPAIRYHRGRIVKRLGDGLMATFPSPAEGVAAALAIRFAAAEAPAIGLRIGVHTGVARSREGDLIGHHVNVASRIADRAASGSILVSGAVRAGASRVPARFRPVRPLRIRGAPPIVLFDVRDA